MFTRQRARIQAIKVETERSKELIERIQSIVDRERLKANPSEAVRAELDKLDESLVSHRQLISENEAMIAKLERPFWKF